MSNYTRITRHPNTGQYHLAEWKDDYFGPHRYGVKFPEDKVVYPAQQVNEAQLKTFWVEDVIEAFKLCRPYTENQDEELLAFLAQINTAYKNRWERDPAGGEGAVEWLRNMKGGPYAEDIDSL